MSVTQHRLTVSGTRRCCRGNPSLAGELRAVDKSLINEINVQTTIKDMFGVKLAKTDVVFGGQYYVVQYVRAEQMLSGRVAVLGVEKRDGPYDILELYTNQVVAEAPVKEDPQLNCA